MNITNFGLIHDLALRFGILELEGRARSRNIIINGIRDLRNFTMRDSGKLVLKRVEIRLIIKLVALSA